VLIQPSIENPHGCFIDPAEVVAVVPVLELISELPCAYTVVLRGSATVRVSTDYAESLLSRLAERYSSPPRSASE
jgi:hypothetical protein